MAVEYLRRLNTEGRRDDRQLPKAVEYRRLESVSKGSDKREQNTTAWSEGRQAKNVGYLTPVCATLVSTSVYQYKQRQTQQRDIAARRDRQAGGQEGRGLLLKTGEYRRLSNTEKGTSKILTE